MLNFRTCRYTITKNAFIKEFREYAEELRVKESALWKKLCTFDWERFEKFLRLYLRSCKIKAMFAFIDYQSKLSNLDKT